MTDSDPSLTRLKRRIARLERPRHKTVQLFPLGDAGPDGGPEGGLDARLGGGLGRGALHELCAAAEGDHPAASGFALMLALCAGGPDRPILWVREDKGERRHGGLYGPGFAELGADPDRFILVQAPDTLSALRAGADIAAALGPGAVVIEPYGAARVLDLTASRKLVLAAEAAGSTVFVLRDMATAMTSAAATRWHVSAAPSLRLPGNAPGHSALALALVRHRGGVAPFEMIVEWNRDSQSFSEAPLSGAVLPAAERGSLAA